jgi:hypothetical protein
MVLAITVTVSAIVLSRGGSLIAPLKKRNTVFSARNWAIRLQKSAIRVVQSNSPDAIIRNKWSTMGKRSRIMYFNKKLKERKSVNLVHNHFLQ